MNGTTALSANGGAAAAAAQPVSPTGRVAPAKSVDANGTPQQAQRESPRQINQSVLEACALFPETVFMATPPPPASPQKSGPLPMRFVATDVLGHGACGVVLAAKRVVEPGAVDRVAVGVAGTLIELPVSLAIKVVDTRRCKAGSDGSREKAVDKARRRFESEVRCMMACTPCFFTVACYGCGRSAEAGGTLAAADAAAVPPTAMYLVAELCNAGDLRSQVRRRSQTQRPYTEQEAGLLFVQVLLAAFRVHSLGFVHRDIKSANIFIMKNGLIKLGDFGFARALHRGPGPHGFDASMSASLSSLSLTSAASLAGQRVFATNGANGQALAASPPPNGSFLPPPTPHHAAVAATVAAAAAELSIRSSENGGGVAAAAAGSGTGPTSDSPSVGNSSGTSGFGGSSAPPSPLMMIHDSFCGTPHIIAPEVWLHERYNAKADVWSLGVVLHELLTLALPFAGRELAEVRRSVLTTRFGDEQLVAANVSRPMRELVAAMLMREQTARPSVREVLQRPVMRLSMTSFVNVLQSAIRAAAALAPGDAAPPSVVSGTDALAAMADTMEVVNQLAAERRRQLLDQILPQQQYQQQAPQQPGSPGVAAMPVPQPPLVVAAPSPRRVSRAGVLEAVRWHLRAVASSPGATCGGFMPPGASPLPPPGGATAAGQRGATLLLSQVVAMYTRTHKWRAARVEVVALTPSAPTSGVLLASSSAPGVEAELAALANSGAVDFELRIDDSAAATAGSTVAASPPPPQGPPPPPAGTLLRYAMRDVLDALPFPAVGSRNHVVELMLAPAALPLGVDAAAALTMALPSCGIVMQTASDACADALLRVLALAMCGQHFLAVS